MSRPVSGKPRTFQIKSKRKNGDIYVYERTSIYDPKKGYDQILSSKLIGKIKAGSDEIVPTRPRRKPQQAAAAQSAEIVKMHVGLTGILEYAGAASGIDEDLKRSMAEDGKGMADKILSLARYWVGTEGDTLVHIKYWQLSHPLPYPGMSEDIYHDLFVELGHRADISHKFFKRRAARLENPDCIAIDSTTFGTYSQRIGDARQGFNKDGDGLDTIKYLSLYAIENRQPLAFTRQPGNIPDVLSVKNAIRKLDWLELNKPTVVMDAGFSSNDNITGLLLNNLKFITRVDLRSCAWIKKLALENLDRFKPFDARCPFDLDTSGFTLMVKHKFTTTCKYNTENHKAGDELTIERRLYLHFFYNRLAAADKSRTTDLKLHELRDKINEGKFAELSASAQRQAEELFTLRKTKEGIRAIVKDDAYDEISKLYGVFVLVSNNAKISTFEALSIYRARNIQETYFSKDKSMTDARRPRVQTSDTLDGRFFCQMMALGYREFLYQRLREVKKQLDAEIKAGQLPEGELKIRRKLRTWLRGSSLQEILEWFDAIELLKLVKPDSYPARTICITTETTKRDELFLRMLGVTCDR